MGPERRGRADKIDLTPTPLVGEEPMERSKLKVTSFDISKRLVFEAWEKVRDNHGAPGVDAISIAQFAAGETNNLYKLWNRMSAGSYMPSPVRAVEIPKDHGAAVRVLGVPSVADRIAQTAVAKLLEVKVEPIFHPDSYGYRPGRSAHDALAVCRQRCWKQDWALDLDVRAFFDSVPHDLLLKTVAHHTDLRWVLLYIERWLKAPMQMPDGTLVAREKGTPQGSPISPLLANIVLHRLDQAWQYDGQRLGRLVRYADDFVVICNSARQATEAQQQAAAVLADFGLSLSAEKTRIVELTTGKDGFDFLGFHLRKIESWKWRGRWYLQRWPSTRAMNSIRAKIRALTDRRYVTLPIHEVVARLNPVIRGWGNYFRAGNSARKFHQIDSYLHERLAILTANKHQKSGRRWATDYDAAWFDRLGVHTLGGTVRYGSAHALR
jgi:RNA-directed DNA polymerase